MSASIGSIIRSKREKLKLTREQVAKKIKISKGYLGHLENDSHVHFSENLALKISKVLKLSNAILKRRLKKFNEKSREWHRNNNR